MKIAAFLESLDGVEDAELKSQYQKVDGGFVFMPDGLSGDKARPHYDKIVAPELHGALEKERDVRRLRGEKLDEWTRLGMEPADVEKIIVKHKATLEKGAKEGDQSKVEEMKEIHQKEKKAWEARERELEGEVETYTTQKEMNDAIEAAKGSKTLLLPHLEKYVKRVVENGKKVVRVLKEDGSVRLGDAEGTPMTPRQFVESLKENEAFKPAFSVDVPEGAGTPRGAGATTPIVGAVTSAKQLKTDAEKVAFIQKFGREKFEALPRE